MGLLFQARDESTGPRQRSVVVVHTEKQKEAITGFPMIGTHQGGMLVGAPLVKAEQDRAIRIENLAEVLVSRACPRLAEERLVPLEALSYIANSYDRPRALHLRFFFGYFSGKLKERMMRHCPPDNRNISKLRLRSLT